MHISNRESCSAWDLDHEKVENCVKANKFLSFKSIELKFHSWLSNCIIVGVVQLLSCNHMDCSTPGFPVPHCLPEFAQTYVHWVSDSFHLIISSSVTPFFSCPQISPASGSFPISCLFTSGDQSIGTSTSVPPMNIQDWFPLGWTGWISLQSTGLWRVSSSTTVQKHQFFRDQPSLWSSSQNRTIIALWL